MKKIVRFCDVCTRPYIYDLDKYPNSNPKLCPICYQFEKDLEEEELMYHNLIRDTNKEGTAPNSDRSNNLFLNVLNSVPSEVSLIEIKGEELL